MATQPQRVRVGIDYDGTIADTNVMKARWIRAHLGLEVRPWQCDRSSCEPIIGAENYLAMSNVVYEREWSLATPPVPGALEALVRLARVASLLVVSARRRDRLAYAREWLRAHRRDDLVAEVLSSVGVGKHALCRQHHIDVLIDDDARHFACGASRGPRAIWLKPGLRDEARSPRGVELATSWAEVLTLLSAPPTAAPE